MFDALVSVIGFVPAYFYFRAGRRIPYGFRPTWAVCSFLSMAPFFFMSIYYQHPPAIAAAEAFAGSAVMGLSFGLFGLVIDIFGALTWRKRPSEPKSWNSGNPCIDEDFDLRKAEGEANESWPIEPRFDIVEEATTLHDSGTGVLASDITLPVSKIEESQILNLIAEELESGRMDKGLWLKARISTSGSNNEIEKEYVALRMAEELEKLQFNRRSRDVKESAVIQDILENLSDSEIDGWSRSELISELLSLGYTVRSKGVEGDEIRYRDRVLPVRGEKGELIALLDSHEWRSLQD